MEDSEKYFQNIKYTQDLILETIYGYYKQNIFFTEEKIKKDVKIKFKERYNEPLDDTVFNGAFSGLLMEKNIEPWEIPIPEEKRLKTDKNGKLISYKEKNIFLKMTPKGITKVLDKELYQKVEEAKKSIEEVEQKVGKKIDNTILYMESIRDEVTDIKKDIDDIRKEFYGRILQIFGIFVSIFAFIVVGFTQIPLLVGIEKDFWTNLSNVSAVFFPLLAVLLILMGATAIIVKKT